MSNPIERGIIPPSKADIAAANRAALQPDSLLISWAKRLGPPILAGTGLAIACAPQEINKPAIVESAKPVSTATAIGIGAVFVPTGNEEADQIQKRLSDPATRSSVSEEDILKFNQVVAKRAQATAEAGGIPKEVPTPVPAPEAKKEVQCGFFSPEVCATGKYIKWNVRGGIQVEGIGFIVNKPGEKIIIPEDLQVAAQPVRQPNVYNGYRISGASKTDGKDYTIFGDTIPTEGITDVGKDLVAGSLIGKSGGTGLTVFTGYPYTHVLIGPNLKTIFPEQINGQPEVINNTPPSTSTSQGGGLTFYDVPPPKG